MSAARQRSPVGLPRYYAGWISLAWFLLGGSATLVALLPLEHDLRRRAELELLTWLKGEGDTLRPGLVQPGRHRLDATARLPARREATPGQVGVPRYASHAQLWLVSAAEGDPGLIVPVSADAVAPASLRDFSLLQAGIGAARGSVTRPLALFDAPEGRQVVAYLRLTGTDYGISASMRADLLYRQVRPRLLAVAAVAATLLACACAGLFRLIAAPTEQTESPAVPASPEPAPSAPGPAEVSAQEIEGGLQRILYHTATLEHEGKADPRLHEHLAEIRETARQGLASLQRKRG